MAVKQTTMIRASITAYSTAVGPSSETIKRLTLRASAFMVCPLKRKIFRQPCEVSATVVAPGLSAGHRRFFGRNLGDSGKMASETDDKLKTQIKPHAEVRPN